ncbi:MAG: hypothetical protein KDB38_01305 [Nocardioidaceae bacterium]|nr:hypothetical protein [Nocardioidaceae bacterium]MCB8992853.1 hypothetical protein [Nocardioidaceae bacterium]
MLIDCDNCLARGPGCGDCVVTALLGPMDDLCLDQDDQTALAVLADTGLVPPLRLVTPVDSRFIESA